MANYMCYDGYTRANKICVLNNVLCACLGNKYIEIEHRKLNGQKIKWETMYAICMPLGRQIFIYV